MTARDNRDYIRVLSYSYYTTITGWGVLLSQGVVDLGRIYSRVQGLGPSFVHVGAIRTAIGAAIVPPVVGQSSLAVVLASLCCPVES